MINKLELKNEGCEESIRYHWCDKKLIEKADFIKDVLISERVFKDVTNAWDVMTPDELAVLPDTKLFTQETGIDISDSQREVTLIIVEDFYSDIIFMETKTHYVLRMWEATI